MLSKGLGGGAVNGSMGANEDQLVELLNGSLLLNSRSLATGSPQQRVQALSTDGGVTFTPSRTVPELPEPFNGCQGSMTRGTSDGGGGRDGGSAGIDGGIINRSAAAGPLYFSHPNPAANKGIAPALLKLLGANVNLTGRDHMTVWKSEDEGESWQVQQLVDAGAAGYSSLQPASSRKSEGRGSSDSSAQKHVPRGGGSGGGGGGGGGSGSGSLWILYEQSDRQPKDLSHLAAEELIGALSVLDPDRFVLRLLTT